MKFSVKQERKVSLHDREQGYWCKEQAQKDLLGYVVGIWWAMWWEYGGYVVGKAYGRSHMMT